MASTNVEKIVLEVEKLSASEIRQLINALLGKYFLPKSAEDENENETNTGSDES